VLEYHTSKSVVTVQCAFLAKYAKDPPTDKTIRAWYEQFTETGCLCKQKPSGRPLTTEDDGWVRASFLHSPKKLMGTAAKALTMLKQECGGFCVSVWCLKHTTAKWYNKCRMKITGAGLISVYSYKT
jgi:hypothetical protein